MGIKNILPFLRKECPEIFYTTNISVLKGKKVAVDVSIYLYRYICSCGDDDYRWLDNFISLICCCKKNLVQPIFVFDGDAPEEKKNERMKRVSDKIRLKEKLDELEFAVQELEICEDVTELVENPEFDRIYSICKSTFQDIYGESFSIDLKDVYSRLDELREFRSRLRKQTVRVTGEHLKLVMDVCDSLGIQYVKASTEAEMTCAFLCIKGIVDGALTEDTDVLAYGCPMFISKFNSSTGECVIVNYSDILESLELTPAQFTDLCIMSGCDYNSNIPKIGCSKAYKLLKEHKTLDNVEKTGINTRILNFRRSRELFSLPKEMTIQLTRVAEINEGKMQQIIFRYNLRVKLNKIKEDFTTQIVFK